ncbi:MAG TPA: NosD domain-containing protein [Geminicoccaceae bacterium]|nr:NosD domain-containing protein [Geminicoccus sp.]HMU48617.1 NosD domain-containing protein [Geminicoccaceae bacterium]
MGGGIAAAVGLLLAAGAAQAQIRTAPLDPAPPDYAAAVAGKLARAEARIAALEPPRSAPGAVEIIDADDAPALRKSFIDTTRRARGWSGRAIRIASGGWTLGDVALALAAPELLACHAGRCGLGAPLLVEAGAALHIGAAAGSAELRLDQARGAFVVSHGLLDIRDASISGRRPDGAPATGVGPDFRPFLLVNDAGRLVIDGSRLAHLGYDAPTAYGVTLSTTERIGEPAARPSALIHDSTFRDLHYGFYSHGAAAVDILDSRYLDCVVYGIDPHDGTSDMLVAGNTVQGTRIAHGIIASRRVADIVVHDNRSIGNAGSGIALDRGVTGAVVAGNLVTGNAANGITLYESHDVTLAGNRIVRNGRNGIRLRQAAGIWIAGNIVVGNGRHGLEASNRTPEREATPEEASFARPVTLTLAGNRFAGNRESACSFKGIARLDLVPAPAGTVLAACGDPPSVAGDLPWAAAIAEADGRHEPLRLAAP